MRCAAAKDVMRKLVTKEKIFAKTRRGNNITKINEKR